MARILVIEDDPASLELMRYLLHAFGHEVRLAMDGMAGLSSAHRERPEIIVCDVQLPDVDGLEIARRLKADPAMRDIPLVAVTASAMVGDRRSVLAAGFDLYIAKPIVPPAFVEQIAAVARAAGVDAGRG
ncbi:response regulator [bacterium]|nr:response regulator [bacterium]